jgi:isopentenyl phosphate kinase
VQVVKLGGSVVTNKEKPMAADHDNIRRLAEEIKAAWPTPLVVIHGGGSFGHPVAKKYGIAEGFTSERQVIGFTRTHQAMVTLNTIIVDALLDEGIPAISVAPSSFITTNDGRIPGGDFDNVGRIVVKGMLPVLYGDAVIDRIRGFSILSWLSASPSPWGPAASYSAWMSTGSTRPIRSCPPRHGSSTASPSISWMASWRSARR